MDSGLSLPFDGRTGVTSNRDAELDSSLVQPNADAQHADAQRERSLDAAFAPHTTLLLPRAGLSGFHCDPSVWQLDAGELVAQAPLGTVTTNSFCTYEAEQLSDFVLRGEVWVSAGGNSGVQYRSELFEPATFRVRGYQLDLGDGVWGSLYDEGLRGQLVAPVEPCQQSARSERWSRFEVHALGDTLVHVVEGLECARFREPSQAARSRGVIALQYHTPGGYTLRFRELTLERR